MVPLKSVFRMQIKRSIASVFKKKSIQDHILTKLTFKLGMLIHSGPKFLPRLACLAWANVSVPSVSSRSQSFKINFRFITQVSIGNVLKRQDSLSIRRFSRGGVHYSFFLHVTIDLSITHIHCGRFGMIFSKIYTAAVYSWSIANNFVIDVFCRCLEILCQIAFRSVANCFRSYRKKVFGLKSIGIYSRHQ